MIRLFVWRDRIVSKLSKSVIYAEKARDRQVALGRVTRCRASSNARHFAVAFGKDAAGSAFFDVRRIGKPPIARPLVAGALAD